MKRWIFGLLAACLLLFGGNSYATGDHATYDNDRAKCYASVEGLKKAAQKVKNEREKQKLWDKIIELKKKCEKMDDKKKMTDEQRVQADKAALAIGFSPGDSIGRVTQSISLPGRGANGSTIQWTSGSPTYLSNSGKLINRPPASSGQVQIVLFAVIQSNKAHDYKMFTLTFNPQLNDGDRVAADKAALQIDFGGNDASSRVTRPFDALPSTGANGSQINWISSAPSIISHDGKTVNRPARGAGDATVVMTATLRAGGAADTKVFVLTVKQQYNDEERVAADKAELAIGFSGSDTANRVTANVTLPVKGHYGSDILWVTDKPSVITSSGIVYRPSASSGDATVLLTAVILSNGRADYKSFSLIVKSY